MTHASAILVVAVPVVAWRVFVRVRQLVKRQRSIAWRHWTTAVFFPLLSAMIGIAAWNSTPALSGLAVGGAAGAALGLWGLRLTRFEQTPRGLYFTPNAYLGLTVSLLLVCRILYRVAQIAARGGEIPTAGQQSAQSPLTLLVFGLMAGYYTTYSIGLLRVRRNRVHQPEIDRNA